MHAAMFRSLIARKGMYQSVPNLARLWLDKEEISEMLKLRKCCPSEGFSCNSKTKHDRKMAPRPELFYFVRKLQEGHNPKKK
jgi:hypothetical protein